MAFLAGFVLLLIGGFPHASGAQTYSFGNVTVEGNQRIETSTILTYAGIGRGEAVSAAGLNQAYQNIAGTGLFEKVEVIPQGNTLLIRVAEFPTINQIAFEGNRRVNDDALSTLIQSKSRQIYSPSLAEADAAAISDSYRQTGRLAATVSPKIIRRSENRVDLVFEITEGRPTEIQRISFVGNRNYSDYRLRGVLETRQAGLLHQFISKDTLVTDRLEFDKQLLRDFYLSRGFIDFEVLSVTSELDRNRSGFLLTFNVREGQRYRIANVSVTSEIPGLDTEAYLKATRLRPGAVYSPVPIDTDIVRLERLAVAQSLNFIQIEPRITRNNRDLTLNVEYVIKRGPRIFIERIDIEGNTTTLDQVVRRQFDAVEGDPFNPREIRQGAERIKALGYFADSNVDTQPGTSPDLVIVNVDVEERPTGSFGFGASYSTNDGFGVNLSFSERNFLGRGQALGFDIGTTGSSTSFGFNFAEPYFLGRDVRFGFDLFYRSTVQDNALYNTDRGLIRPSLTFPIGEQTRLGVRLSAEYGKVYDVSDDSSNILQKEEDMGGLYSIGAGYTFSYSTLATGLDPTSGIFLSFSQDFGYRDDNATFVQTEALLRAKKSILNEDVNFRAELEGGNVAFYGGDSRIIERYSLSNKIRGFKPNGVGPRDLHVENEDVLNGNFFAVARMEVDFPLGLPQEYGILGGLFWDIGSVWQLDNTNGGENGDNPVDDGFHLRSAAGISIFWDTPLGPLRFNFSRPLMLKAYDEPQNFEFTVATRF